MLIDYTFGNQVYALLIGIDEYKDPSIKNLAGCVNDCKDVKGWLEESFRSPEIVFLENSKASRDAIMEEINKIAASSVVREDDPILIYFAGHGAEVEPLKKWKLHSGRKVQMRIPYDFIRNPSEFFSLLLSANNRAHSSTLDPDDLNTGKGIYDRDLSKALAKLSMEKGTNIVVILDSCHSASGSRAGSANQEQEETIRSIELSGDYANLASLEESDFGYPDDTGRFSRASSTTPTNHILLAACREDRKARERLYRERRGVFTYELLKKFRERDTEKMTYDELILSIGPLGSQFPHCDSINKDCILFSLDHKRHEFHSVDPRHDSSGNTSCLQVGQHHGVQSSDRFLIFREDQFSFGGYICEASIKSLRRFNLDLEFNADVVDAEVGETKPNSAFAVKIIQSPSIRILAPQDVLTRVDELAWFSNIGANLVSHGDVPQQSEKHVLRLIYAERRIKFKFLNATHPVPETYDHSWPLESEDDFIRLFHHVGHFFHYLHHPPSPLARDPPDSYPIQVSIVRLDDSTPGNNTGVPLSPDPEPPHHVLADNETKYGYMVTNHSSVPIFFSLFYFGLRELYIDAMYNPPTVASGNATPCLLSGESKTIGYGSPGDSPFVYWLEEDETSDAGYLRLFFSDQYLDLLHIKRSTIMQQDCNPRDLLPKRQGQNRRDFTKPDIDYLSSVPSFQAFTFLLVQVRGPVEHSFEDTPGLSL
ncbi:hypothetical protein DXG01_009785 [Tephrocybe rancida]|nr:hypothetical protein DXG01_009785 [Tephrocybe rancida]